MNVENSQSEMYRQKDQVAFDLKELIASTQALLNSTASYTGAEIEEARGRLKSQLESAQEQAMRWNDLARETYRQASEATDEYVRTHPWPLLGAAAVLGIIAGQCLNAKRRH